MLTLTLTLTLTLSRLASPGPERAPHERLTQPTAHRRPRIGGGAAELGAEATRGQPGAAPPE